MLNEIICEKFKQKKIVFHKGLNVILGDELGSNSIGKSTFLMIVDFVFGGKDYVMKSTEIQRNVGKHTIKFMFTFENIKYYFSRNTEDTEYVYICDNNYEIVDRISLEQYTNQLKRLYGFGEKDVSFREVVGRYIRVYGKENLNEKRPLDVVRNEKVVQSINALLKLFGLFDVIKELEELAKNKNDELKVFKNAQKFHFISKINGKQRKENDKKLLELEREKEKITDELSYNLMDFNSEKTEMILKLKKELSDCNRRICIQNGKLLMLQDSVLGNIMIDEEDLANLKLFFPEINLKQLVEIQNFHREIAIVLDEEIKDEITNIKNVIQILQESKEQVEFNVRELTNASNLPQVILFKFAEIQKKIESIMSQNQYYDEKFVRLRA